MALVIDPQGREIDALRRVANWRRAQVLEVGCGEGRLTVRLAKLGARVTAFDVDRARVRRARRALPKRYAGRVTYSTGSAERLKHPDESFDIVVFAWSL